MTDFDSNPFADPTTASPFQDPSVQQATANASRGLEEFNPFEDSNKQTNTSVPSPVPAQSTQPAVVNTGRDAPPAYSTSAAQSATSTAGHEDLLRRQAELEEKAAELQRREQQLKNAQYNIRENNFPPLPKWFPVGPCFYQDFAVDIPSSFQRIVKIGFYLWLAYCVQLFLNFLVMFLVFVSSGHFAIGFALALIYLVVFSPGSYICWFRPVYKAFRYDRFSAFHLSNSPENHSCLCVYILVLAVNFVVAVMAFAATGDHGVTFGLSLIYLLVFGPCSYLCWFRPVYNAFSPICCGTLFDQSHQVVLVGYSILLIVNLLVALAYFIASGVQESGTTFFVSIFYLVLMPPASYLCWFRPVYNAFRNDSSFNFFLFFFTFFFQCIVTAVLALGLDNLGACGWKNSIMFITKGSGAAAKVIAIIMLVIALCFTAMAVVKVYYLYQVHSLYRSTGASFEKAQAEFAKSVASNPGVQSATKQAASAAVSGAVSGTMSGNQM